MVITTRVILVTMDWTHFMYHWGFPYILSQSSSKVGLLSPIIQLRRLRLKVWTG